MKANERNFMILLTLFVISIVIANVVGARVITTGIHIGAIEISTSGGAITYAVTFLCTDIIGEIWGKKKAKSVIKYGFIGQIFATLCIVLTGFFTPVDMEMESAYRTLLGQNWMFVIGSLAAYYASQSWDVFIFHKIRDKYIQKHGSRNGGRWIWNNASTMTSQIIDTLVYASISFGIGLGWFFKSEMISAFIGLVIGQYLLKAFLALIDTPFFYMLTRKRDENVEQSKSNSASS